MKRVVKHAAKRVVKPIIFAANWKMNHGPSAARAFMSQFVEEYAPRDDRRVVFFPPALSFATARDWANARPDLGFGVQNIYWAEKGAFTGELSAPIARDAGAAYVLVGHSERRHVFGETDAQTAEKCAAARRHGLTPVLCVGETLAERERGETEAVVTRQLEAVLPVLTDAAAGAPAFLIAYEPVWAIGTGRNATPDDAAAIHGVLRQLLARTLGDDGAADVHILYGGSVTPANVADLLAAGDVDGVLVGGASLDAGNWRQICSTTVA